MIRDELCCRKRDKESYNFIDQIFCMYFFLSVYYLNFTYVLFLIINYNKKTNKNSINLILLLLKFSRRVGWEAEDSIKKLKYKK